MEDTIKINREKNSRFVYIAGTEPLYTVGKVLAAYECTSDHDGEIVYGKIESVEWNRLLEDWIYTFENGDQICEEHALKEEAYCY